MRKTFLLSLTVLTTVVCWGNPKLYHRTVAEVAQGTIVIADDNDGNYTLTATPASGYLFYQWKDNQSTNPVREVCCLSGNVTYTAQFAAGYTVTFGTEATPVFSGCSIAVMPTRDPQEGFVFAGWSTIENATVPNVVFPYTPTANITLYPVFVQNALSVSSATTTAKLITSQAASPNVDLTINNGGVLTVSEESKATQLNFKSITIKAGGKLVIPTGTFIACAKLIMEGGDADANEIYYFRYPQLVANGTLNVTNNTIYYDYLLSKRQQYPLCLPLDVNIADITYANGTTATFNTDFKVAIYNGETRSTGSTGWAYFTGSKLTAGIGYTVFAKTLTYQLGGNGTIMYEPYSRLRFPMSIAADYTEAQKSVSVSAYPASRANDVGWNLIGNPYLADYLSNVGITGDNATGIHMLTLNPSTGEYEWTGTQRYVVYPADNGKGYYSVLASEANIPAFKNFFVQIGSGDALSFTLANRAQNVAARMLNTTIKEEITAGIILSQQSGNQSQDRLGILIGEDYTSAYEINADLQKIGHNQGTNLYAWADNSELAFVALNEDLATNIPVGFIADQAGSYTFTFDSKYATDNLSEVQLYDSELKKTANLLENAYAFTVNGAQTNNVRFVLSIVLRKTSTSLSSFQTAPDKTKFMQDGKLYIRANGTVYNTIGNIVK